MFNLKLLSIQQTTSPEKPIYLPKESSTAEKKMVYLKGTASSVAHAWLPQEVTPRYHSLYSGRPRLGDQIGMDFSRTVLESYYGAHPILIGDVVGFRYHGLTASAGLSTTRQGLITSDETDEIEIVPIREIPHEYAKLEITRYIQHAGGRKVYISELAKELRLDIELIIEILEELETEQRA